MPNQGFRAYTGAKSSGARQPECGGHGRRDGKLLEGAGLGPAGGDGAVFAECLLEQTWQPGRAFLELEPPGGCCCSASSAWPVLVADDATCAEICSLEQELNSIEGRALPLELYPPPEQAAAGTSSSHGTMLQRLEAHRPPERAWGGYRSPGRAGGLEGSSISRFLDNFGWALQELQCLKRRGKAESGLLPSSVSCSVPTPLSTGRHPPYDSSHCLKLPRAWEAAARPAQLAACAGGPQCHDLGRQLAGLGGPPQSGATHEQLPCLVQPRDQDGCGAASEHRCSVSASGDLGGATPGMAGCCCPGVARETQVSAAPCEDGRGAAGRQAPASEQRRFAHVRRRSPPRRHLALRAGANSCGSTSRSSERSGCAARACRHCGGRPACPREAPGQQSELEHSYPGPLEGSTGGHGLGPPAREAAGPCPGTEVPLLPDGVLLQLLAFAADRKWQSTRALLLDLCAQRAACCACTPS